MVLVVLISLCSIASASSGNMIGRQSEYQLTEDLTCGISGQGNARDSYRCPSSTREQDILDRLLNLPGDEGLRRCCSEVGFCGSSATHCGKF